jgi:5-methylcytosine-specific restriction endonuclease McrA
VCQYVPDNEGEFDHIISYSKGGPTTVDNIRLLCSACNWKKANSLAEILDDSARLKSPQQIQEVPPESSTIG